ncbi:MAG: C1 family peptidase [Melioribacteraceae bacterium]|nr:C1 family peptidase [Melioribacteraceae bacterium]
MKLLIAFLLLSLSTTVFSQETKDNIPHQFEITKKIDASNVKSQGRTGTCWAFATSSFIEAELIRLGKGEIDISEMFFVRKDYPLKAKKFIRYHGRSNFGPGGVAHDVLRTITNYGILPESVYGGKLVDSTKYNHSEMHGILEMMLKSVLDQRGGTISPLWEPAFNSVLDVYLGEVPTSFNYEEIEYTSKSFAEFLGFNPNDYVELTSYSHIPFYEKSNLEIPDNWTNGEYYNIPIDQLIEIMNNSIKMGYSFVWDGDTGKEFFYRSGYAVIPIENWEDNDDPETEKVITQKMRQESFDSFVTTDDHLMHITGLAKNQNDTKFYYTKNSWGSKKGFDGYCYMSESYVRLMTISIMVHKNVIPEELKKRLNI